MVLRLGHDWTPEVLRSELPRLWRVIEELGDEHFDQFMAETLKEVLISEGYSDQQLEKAMTMGTVKTAFQRGLEDIDQRGFRRGRRAGREEGRAEGQEKGQARLLGRQVTRRFGPGNRRGAGPVAGPPYGLRPRGPRYGRDPRLRLRRRFPGARAARLAGVGWAALRGAVCRGHRPGAASLKGPATVCPPL